jgi:hypothetical protein
MTQEKHRFETILMLSDKKGKAKKEPEITVEEKLVENE